MRDAGGLMHKMGITQNTSISKETNVFAMNDFKEAFTVSVTDALDSHCNTLDLRVPLQCKFWIEELPDQVQRFITLGGYRSLSGLYKGGARPQNVDFVSFMEKLWCGCIA